MLRRHHNIDDVILGMGILFHRSGFLLSAAQRDYVAPHAAHVNSGARLIPEEALRGKRALESRCAAAIQDAKPAPPGTIGIGPNPPARRASRRPAETVQAHLHRRVKSTSVPKPHLHPGVVPCRN